MRYPMVTPETVLDIIKDEENGDISYVVISPGNQVLEVSGLLYFKLLYADGTHPVIEDNKVLDQLENIGVLTKKRFFPSQMVSYGLLPLQLSKTPVIKKLVEWIDRVIPTLAIVLFISGILAFLLIDKESVSFSILNYLLLMSSVFLTYFVGSVIAYAAHHQKVALVYFLFYVLPAGVDYDDGYSDAKVSVREEIHMILSGIEAQGIITGILFIIAAVQKCFGICGTAAIASTVCMIIYMLPTMDFCVGEKALSKALGIESISMLANEMAQDKDFRDNVLSTGTKGKQLHVICLGITLLKVLTVFLCLLLIMSIFV